jgi:tetratricopeptide (TPR) repeat protein
MDTNLPDKKKMSLTNLLAKVEDVLQRGCENDPPAYTLILGAGASFGVVPTSTEMLGIRDSRTGLVHDKSIPLWLAKPEASSAVPEDTEERLACVRAFWKRFREENSRDCRWPKIQFDSDGLPESTSVAAAYQAVFDTACVGGLDTPEKHRNYMRHVMMTDSDGQTHLNATHFYLASLLSLQKRGGDLGSDKKPLYTGRREFARTLFTTNFDPLLQTSLQLFQLLYYMTDRPELLPPDALQTDQHPAIHLFYAHGSVYRPYMAHNEEQIGHLKQRNARVLAAYFGSHGVIVLGYAGWDDCLLEALNQCMTFANNLYWLVIRGTNLSEPVRQFLESHPNAYCVEIEDGDSFMACLHARLCPGAPNSELLYNPIQPIWRQLKGVDLSKIRTGSYAEKDESVFAREPDLPRNVDSIQQDVLTLLKVAECLFIKDASPTSKVDETLALAGISYASRNWDAAFSLYNQLLELGNSLSIEHRVLALFRRGVCFGYKGNLDKEIEDYTALIDLPKAPAEQVARALLNRGYRFGQKGDLDKELKDYTALINLPGALVETVAKALFNRGLCFGKRGNQEKEREDYSTLIKLPGAPAEPVARALLNRGIYFGQKGYQEEAQADYTALIKLPGAPAEPVARALLNRGIYFGQKGYHDKAIKDYTALIDLPGAPAELVASARLDRGNSFGKRGDQDKAIADHSALIDLPGAPAELVAKALYIRGCCFLEKGDQDKAIADYFALIDLPGAPAKLVAMAQLNLGPLFQRER